MQKLTEQEVLDRVHNYYIVEGNKFGMSDAGSCVYRGTNGTRCSVGLLIDDDWYDSAFEGKAIQELIEGSDTIREELGHMGEFLTTMQRAHDTSALAGDDFEMKLARIAADYDLTYPPVVAA